MGTWDFTYDTLNRLATADSAADAPAPYTNNYGCWTYDGFGNRLSESMSTTACASNPPLASSANYISGANQFSTTSQSPSGVPYDASGNVLADSAHWFLYDGEGRLCAVASVPMPGITVMTGYLYDADGRRVAKGTITSWSCDPAANGFQSTNDYILGQSGEQVTEMGMNAAGMAWLHTNAYVAGTLLATYDADDLHFYLNDPLGTRRSQTDHAGVPEQTCSGLPFGNGVVCNGGNLEAPTEHHFTGKEHDPESGNDYFGARYYASTMGRMLSPDSGVDQHPEDPQSWNLFSYVRNNPLSFTDPSGHYTNSIAERSGCMQEMSTTDSSGNPIMNGANCSSVMNNVPTYGAVPGGSHSQEGEAAWLASGSIPWYRSGPSGSLQMRVMGGWTPNPDYNVDVPGSLLGRDTTSYWMDVGSISVSYGGGSLYSASSYMVGFARNNTPKPERPQHFWQKPGCGSAIAETALGTAGVVGEAALIWFAGPELLAMGGEAIAEDGLLAGGMDAGHVLTGVGSMLAAPAVLAGHGITNIVSNCR
jgi:RHS repeat-associated protein